MSEIPELDRLLEEAENVRFNTQWDRTDRFMRRTLGCFILSMLLTLVLGGLFGKSGVAFGLGCALLSVMPVLWFALYVLLRGCFTDPPPRDPTKRYKYM